MPTHRTAQDLLMLSTAQVQAVFDRVTYKDGWSLEVYDGRFEGQHVVITTVVADAYDQTKTVTLDVHSSLPPMRDEQAVLEWLAWRLGRLETHEMLEFLRLDGSCWVDPHRTDADQDR
jgi:hypothetical protein